MFYILQAKLITIEDNISQTHVFQKTYYPKFLKKIGVNAIIYDAELKMHFEDKSAQGYLYEIETKDVKVALSSQLAKANDFHKKINYRYNWVQFNVSTEGIVRRVVNKDYLKNTWQKLKTYIREHYEGNAMEKYLKEIDLKYDKDIVYVQATYQYFYFALLFPTIPPNHGASWTNKRKVQISEYEEETFEETVVYKGLSEDGLRIFELELKSLPDSKIIIEKSEGYVIIPVNTILPQSAEIDIVYTVDDIRSEWNFTLIKTR